ncbi:APC family permease [Bacillus cytotoxicus]|uniref:APC family permease n=1 Tax=Bacillus cytotoxicus TaxID=580165 RepID=UPI000B35EB91|nr:APC family permease [Bacillus cytotoxicus]AWC27301.1 amino acid permease [Bacillus cytotoxicus]AWC39414.1 amino acid permease [Bacillus cytotoxicus]AWC47345.1 amino acid permease [Bacillus cytotoxicus]AWC51367.1 amino acid permease [Bacillus cytotoxicus]AWC55496.1 amino acid permease [Bacillus cytotoxicus]
MGEKKLKKVLSRFDVLFLAIGAMLGWGWVVLSGDWVTSAGSMGAVIAFIIGGLLVIFVGLTYAELASAMPETGGGLLYVRKAFGKKAAFVASWAIILGYVSVVTFEAVALPTVVDYVLPHYQSIYLWTIAGWDVYLTWAMIGMGGALFITIINYFGVKTAAVFQSIFTLFIVATGIMLVFGAGFNGDTKNLEPFFIDGIGGVMTVLIMVPFLFVGFDVIPQVAEEVNLPFKEIGKLLIFSVICAVIFYLFIALGVSMALNQKALLQTKLATADAMGAVFGSKVFANILIFGGLAGIITSWNAFIIGGSRVLYAMSKEGMIPAWFGKVHPKYNTPSHSIIFLGMLSFFAPLLGRPALVWIVDAGGLGIVVSYLLVSLSFFILRKRAPKMKRPFQVKNGRVVGSIAIILSIGFIVLYMPGMPAALIWLYEWLMVLGWVTLGGYFFIRMLLGKYKRNTFKQESIEEEENFG